MEFIKNNHINNLFTHKAYNLNLSSKESYLNDLTGKDAFNPRKMRWFNSFEVSQFFRFMIALNWTKEHFSFLEKKEDKKRRKYIADFGCSFGQFYEYWYNNCNYFGWPQIAYYGFDADPKIKQVALTLRHKKSDILKFFLCDLSNPINFEKMKVDVVVCLETLEHIPRRKAFTLMDNINRISKKDGIVIMSSPNPRKDLGEKWTWEDESRHSHAYEWQYEKAKILFKRKNLEIVKKCGILPRRDYRHRTYYPRVRDALLKNFPSTIVHNLLCSIDRIEHCKQWIVLLKRR